MEVWWKSLPSVVVFESFSLRLCVRKRERHRSIVVRRAVFSFELVFKKMNSYLFPWSTFVNIYVLLKVEYSLSQDK